MIITLIFAICDFPTYAAPGTTYNPDYVDSQESAPSNADIPSRPNLKQYFDKIREFYNEKPDVKTSNLSDKDVYTYNITELVYYNKTQEALEYALKYWKNSNYANINNQILIKTLTDLSERNSQMMNSVFASEKYWNEGDIVKAKQLLVWVMNNASTTLDLTTDMIYGTHLANAMQSYRFLKKLVAEPLDVMENYNQQVASIIEAKARAQGQKIDVQQLEALMKLAEGLSEFIGENAQTYEVENKEQKQTNINRTAHQTIYWTCVYHPAQRFYSTRMPGTQGCSYSPDKRHSWIQHIE
jgi:hypothetical protein